jgi:hypothetical protein
MISFKAKTIAMGIGLGLMALPTVGHATTFDLDVADPGAGTGTPTVQGVVTLTQNGADEVDISVVLTSGVLFVNTGGPHTPFLFNLASAESGATVSVTSTNGNPGTFSPASGAQPGTPFGTFTNGIDMSGGNGASNGTPGPLDLSVVDASGITISDFVDNSSGAFFAADLLGTGGGTGTVANTGAIPTTPLPATWTMMLIGLLGFGFVAYRSQKQNTSFTVA